MKKIILSFALLALVCGCSMFKDVEKEAAGKQNDPRRDRMESRGKLTGEDGWTILGGKDKESGGTLGVNSYLWRATLDTLSFMPLASADPFGGTIITDWYENPQTPGERYKVTALILDKTLRADGVRIQMFKQKMGKGGWRDQTVDSKLPRSLEDTILTRARELRVAAGK